ncbi:IS66 family transposase zinc-finger binding domain-containing protein [Amycolatopsis sp. lyj-346]|uniref:IS66 family transposase zinc-finger binding domain-containing protein n=1 Tax=Amycolatopsis sp. lyj-346 TaxID=2789289 RepID=UPI003979B848
MAGSTASGVSSRERREVSLSLVEDPDQIVDHVPSLCSGCRTGLRPRDEVGVTCRQVVDLPEVRPSVAEHRLHRLRCRGCCRVPARETLGCQQLSTFPSQVHPFV